MENTLFRGCLISWIIGLPFIVLINLTNDDPRIGALLINEVKMTDGNELLSQLKFLTKLVISHSKNAVKLNYKSFQILIEMIRFY